MEIRPFQELKIPDTLRTRFFIALPFTFCDRCYPVPARFHWKRRDQTPIAIRAMTESPWVSSWLFRKGGNARGGNIHCDVMVMKE